MPARRGARSPAHNAVLAIVLALAACGGDASRSSGEPRVLFDGSASNLLPHETGRSARFRSTAMDDGKTAVSESVATVVENAADGAFVTEQVLDDGRRARIAARDTGAEIRVEGAVVEPGSPLAQTIELDPPAVIVRTPVVAGEPIQTRFMRLVEVAIDVGGETLRRRVPFVGNAERTPRDLASADVPAGHFDGAIRYFVSARGSAEVPLGGAALELSAAIEGEELIAPGVGLVREAIDLRVTASGSEARGQIVTERLPAG